MSKTTVMALLGATICSIPSIGYAQTYSRVGVGISINDKYSREYDSLAPSTQRVHADMEKSGLNATASIGYDFGDLRVEGQAQYSRLKASHSGCLNCGPTNAPYVEDTAELRGKERSLSGYANVLYDFPSIGEILQFSVGGGVGYSSIKLRTDSTGSVERQRGSANNLALQGIIEARVNVTDSTAVSLRYSYQHMGKLKVDRLNGAGVLQDSVSKTYAYQNYTIGISQQF